MPAEPRGGWDVHTHLIPPAIVDDARRGRHGMEVIDDTLVTAAARVPLGRISTADLLVGWLDEQGLDGAVVSPPPPLYRPDIIDQRDWVQRINDGMREMCSLHVGRLQPMAYLPAEAPSLAVELAMDLDEGWRGVTLGTDTGDHAFWQDAYHPLWGLLEDRALVAFIHPGASNDDRLDRFYLANLLGNPYETTVVAAHLVFGGVLASFPRLPVLLAHGGGAVSQLAGRWQRGYELGRTGSSGPGPVEVLRTLHVDSLVHDAGALGQVIEVFGRNRVMFGSDWPFPMGAQNADLGLSADLSRAVRVDNSRRMFGSGPALTPRPGGDQSDDQPN